MTPKLQDILLAEEAGKPLFSIETAELQVGKGIVGDRYYNAQGTFSKALKSSQGVEVTLIEQEEIDHFNAATTLNYSGTHFRRNLITQNIRLNDLVGKEFSIGDVKLKGIRLCEPCAYLAKKIGPEVLALMVHKAGLRAQIIVGGKIHISDTITNI